MAIAAASAVGGTVGTLVKFRGFGVPAVVVELLLGVLIGPQVLGLHVSPFVSFFADLGLGMLFYFAGYEIDPERIRGKPLGLGVIGWGLSLVLAYTIGGALAAAESCCRSSTPARRWPRLRSGP